MIGGKEGELNLYKDIYRFDMIKFSHRDWYTNGKPLHGPHQ